ncbi:MAG: hypothetical protein ABIE14_02405 [Patescibacteria group bacterium]
MSDIHNPQIDLCATLSREAWDDAQDKAKKVREPTRKQVEEVTKT